ncbi:acyl-CoA carboxylase epsilon subunit [Streptomyces sp. BBFR51]|uniref:acyl-CoA carboxylase epsilon subunit n=1 Tax=Streptomyces sp. BBFR51 TaxID=3372856 RepID=UPI0037DDDA39
MSLVNIYFPRLNCTVLPLARRALMAFSSDSGPSLERSDGLCCRTSAGEGVERMKNSETLLVVERGRASEEELAALAVVVLAAREGRRGGRKAPPTVRAGRWWERSTTYASPGSWR